MSMLTTMLAAAQPDPEAARTFAQLAYDSVFGHYFLDWGASITGLIAAWRLGSKHKDGFIWGSISCVFWIAFNAHVLSLPGIAFNAIWIVFNVRGILRWTREHSAATTQAATTQAATAPIEPNTPEPSRQATPPGNG